MSDVIERIEQSVKKHSYHIVHGINNHDEGMTVRGFYQVIDEELAKNTQECEIARYMESCEDCGFCELRESSVNRVETQ